MSSIIIQIAEYTRLCREFSELPRNADSPEAYKSIQERKDALKEQILELGKEMGI